MQELPPRPPGAHAAMDSWHASRTATAEAAFFLPHLQPGMRLLDLGCGPGTITADLATRVAPGEVVGIDIDPQRVAQAQALAQDHGLRTVTIQAGDVHHLPFAEASFDAVFEHAVFMHLRDSAQAAAEAFRVLTPGGCFGGRDGDRGGWLWSPPERPVFTECAPLLDQLFATRGSNPYFGHRLAAVVRGAGFQRLAPTVSYRMFHSADARATIVRILEGLLTDPQLAETARGQGVDLAARVPVALAELRVWATDPDAFLAQSQCEVVAWKPAQTATPSRG